VNQTKRNLWLDISIFVAFLLTAFTGISLWLLIPHPSVDSFLGFSRHFWLTAHLCSGLASLAGSIVHVIWHRAWLKALRKRRIASLPSKLRSNRITDRFVWITFLAATVFGVIDWIFLTPEKNLTIFTRLHAAVGIACILGIIVHLALHTKWITSSIKNIIQVKKKALFYSPDRLNT
jgi:hypothetical protein